MYKKTHTQRYGLLVKVHLYCYLIVFLSCVGFFTLTIAIFTSANICNNLSSKVPNMSNDSLQDGGICITKLP